MKTAAAIVVLVALGFAVSGPASSRQSRSAAVRPVAMTVPMSASMARTPTTPAPPPMSKDFSVLETRSIFRRPDVPAVFVPPPPPPPVPPPAPAETLVFNGVANVGGRTVAFLEDVAANKVLVLHVGDHVGRGTIAHITFNRLDYQSGSGVTRVPIGETLTAE